MAADSLLLSQGIPTLRFYGWDRETISLGKHQSSELSLTQDPFQSIPKVRRPTGGRAVLHANPSQELTYALVMPHLAEQGLGQREAAYRHLCEFLRRGLAHLGIPLDDWIPRGHRSRAIPARLSQRTSCFATQTAADLTYQGQKIIGSAQVWGRGVVLQQGSILLQPDRERWSQLWPQDPHRVIGLQEILGSPIQTSQLIEILVQAATDVFGIPWQVQDWIPAEQLAIQDIAANFQISE